MKQYMFTSVLCCALTAPAAAASLVNNDGEARVLVITEGGKKSELVVGAGETIGLCSTGCFLTMPNGDREVLTGDEALEIVNGHLRYQ